MLEFEESARESAMTLPSGFRGQWPSLPEITGIQVVRRILEHERMTRADIQAALVGVDILGEEGHRLLRAIRSTSRYTMAQSILTGFRVWRLWTPTVQQLLDVSISDDIHFRADLAPNTGTLEAGDELAKKSESNEFSQMVATWRSSEPGLGGLTAVWVKPDELGLIEGCHRLIAFSSLCRGGWAPTRNPTFQLAVGQP